MYVARFLHPRPPFLLIFGKKKGGKGVDHGHAEFRREEELIWFVM